MNYGELFLKLLDIRVGRANRMQAFVLAIGLSMLAQLVTWFIYTSIQSRPEFAPLNEGRYANFNDITNFATAELFINYLLLVVVVRRVRDLNYKPLVPVIFAIVILLFESWMRAMDLFGDGSFAAGQGVAGVVAFISLPAASLSGLALVVLVISPGTPGPNRYGAEPVGLDFRTMVKGATAKDRKAFEREQAETIAPWRHKGETSELYEEKRKEEGNG